MKAFIWDLDGTLIESYDAIVKALEVTYQHFQWPFDPIWIRSYILEYSVGKLLHEQSENAHIPFQRVKDFYSAELKNRDHELGLMEGAKEILEWAKLNQVRNFMYTHKGDNTHHVLKNLGINHYFEEVITGDSGFERKPHPEAINYLIKKHSLDKANTFYIGDRRLDKEVAFNSGVRSINLTQDNEASNLRIQSLHDIPSIIL